MALKWLIVFFYFILDWFIPGIGLSENLVVLETFITPIFLILIILLFTKSLIEDFKKLHWEDVLLVVVISMVLLLLGDRLFAVEGVVDEKISVSSWIYLLSAVTYGPFFEEMIFRYCIIPLSGTNLSKVLALILSAAFFSLVHGFSFSFFYFISGLIFGVVYLLKRNIWYPIIVHYVNNLIAVGIVLFYIA